MLVAANPPGCAFVAFRGQWEKLLGMADEIRNFIRVNDHALKKKE